MKHRKFPSPQQIGEAVFRGEKSLYNFEVYPLSIAFNEVPAVYVISKRKLDKNGKAHHFWVCVGETESLSDEVKKHRRAKSVKLLDANSISVILEEDEQKRRAVENDLRAARLIPCLHKNGDFVPDEKFMAKFVLPKKKKEPLIQPKKKNVSESVAPKTEKKSLSAKNIEKKVVEKVKGKQTQNSTDKTKKPLTSTIKKAERKSKISPKAKAIKAVAKTKLLSAKAESSKKPITAKSKITKTTSKKTVKPVPKKSVGKPEKTIKNKVSVKPNKIKTQSVKARKSVQSKTKTLTKPKPSTISTKRKTQTLKPKSKVEIKPKNTQKTSPRAKANGKAQASIKSARNAKTIRQTTEKRKRLAF